MIEIAAYFLAFIFICAFLVIMLTFINYLLAFVFWLTDTLLDPFLLNKFDK
mgnify:CR=1 FL=1|tara:strand:- start:829 stop:981 length:153 start_codon:yes stop_codon:yes gene_type:complete